MLTLFLIRAEVISLILAVDVVEANQEQHALDKLVSIRSDLIICDLRMQEMNSITSIERFR
ncbi:hypothetical protein BG74_02415 [Sodalis-like endosymbiont of Proechinophthirus fluctus]|uniref:hypothetical protein n=1 Tax=Sodalis-like endosymbiont of Proechinophthirus fluctus TaxID=1462730 RepID=UPI0007A92BE1|nr:hypothetical protein [Sodalis-like endosymbiont of Proechinophthirus fluctus]KYP97530.1 hypothetical protein BG74_02415 [Sodalis-like endosymbiont of Proechinophthirus fluctus]